MSLPSKYWSGEYGPGHWPSTAQVERDITDQNAELEELGTVPVAQSPDGDSIHRHDNLGESPLGEREFNEQNRSQHEESSVEQHGGDRSGAEVSTEKQTAWATAKVSRRATQIYTLSYLVLFSIFGTLARLGVQALTTYPGAPVTFGILWANLAGSLIMGFLIEDRMLFKFEWGTPTYHLEILKSTGMAGIGSRPGSEHVAFDLSAAKKAHLATKKTIPLYIGLATGFCGSFTSFSSFIRDAFLTLSNDLPTPGIPHTSPRSGGYSFMALIAVILTTVSLSLSALFTGAHLAIMLKPFTPSLPYRLTRKYMDPAAVVLGWGCWLGAIILSIYPPHDKWRGQALYSLVFAPLGCLTRFFASLHLNGRVASFPMGTFAVNVLGTMVLGMSWDLAHVPLGGIIGCQVLQGIQDGFCGCLTTVSTWVAELASLRKRHAYTYGGLSVVISLAALVAIMGGVRWTHGFEPVAC